MKVSDLVLALELEVLADGAGLEREIAGGYCSDLLSDVMAHARAGDVWITLQTHANIVAVATLVNAAAVIISGGHRPDAATLARALSEGATVLASDRPTFELAGRLYALLHGAQTADR